MVLKIAQQLSITCDKAIFKIAAQITITKSLLLLLAAGTTIAINNAYKAMFIA